MGSLTRQLHNGNHVVQSRLQTTQVGRDQIPKVVHGLHSTAKLTGVDAVDHLGLHDHGLARADREAEAVSELDLLEASTIDLDLVGGLVAKSRQALARLGRLPAQDHVLAVDAVELDHARRLVRAVDALDGLLDDPGLAILGQHGNKGVVQQDLLTCQLLVVDGELDLATHQVHSLVGLDDDRLLLEGHKRLPRAANHVVGRQRVGVLVDENLLLCLRKGLDLGSIRELQRIKLHLFRPMSVNLWPRCK